MWGKIRVEHNRKIGSVSMVGAGHNEKMTTKALRDVPRRALKCTVMSYVLSFLLAEDALAGFAVKVAH